MTNSPSPPSPKTVSRLRVSAEYGWLLVVCSMLLLTCFKVHEFWQDRFQFDDAYMYCRYAYNFRHGWGIAWNPAGPHTFGITSLPWFFVILAGSYVAHGDATLLTGASCITGIIAIAVLSQLIVRSSKSSLLRQPVLLLPCLAFSLILNAHFGANWNNGMETMLGMLGVICFLAAHKHSEDSPGWRSLVVLCVASIFCVLTRPETLLLVVAFPVVAWILPRRDRDHRPQLVAYGALLTAMLSVVVSLNKHYFGTAVPLAFYLKALHGYDGYRLFIDPWSQASTFCSIALPFLLILVGCTAGTHLRMLAPFICALLLELLYLATVTQIMGGEARYYLPLLPLVIVPAMRILDAALLERRLPRMTATRAASLLVVISLTRDYTQQVTWFAAKQVAKKTQYYAKPVFQPDPSPALPMIGYWTEAAKFASQLPAGTTMAASEVGMLGASAPQIRLLDLAGLNDAHLALHPCDVGYVFAQKPDVIWLPHSDYTRFYGEFASAPELLQQYDLYDGALTFGLAIRKSSLTRPSIREAFDRGWALLYPGYRKEDYLVHRVFWDSKARSQAAVGDILE